MMMRTTNFFLFRQLLWAATLAIGFATLWLVLVFFGGSSPTGGMERP